MRLVSDNDLSFVFLAMGELDKGLKHAEQAIASYSPHLHRLMIREGGLNTGVSSRCSAALSLQLSGHPDQSRERLYEATALARDVAHPYSLAFALSLSALASQLCRDVQTTQGHTMELVTLSTEYGFQMFLAFGIALQGWTMAVQGQAAEGLVQVRQGLAMLQATDTAFWRSCFLSLLAEVYKEAGQLEQGLAALNDGIAFVERTGERFYEAEIHRLKGELLWMQGEDEAEVEGYYQHAIEVARRQRAKWLELRAVMSLSRLWQKQGKREEARQRLVEIYGWFTEGFDTPDLKEARALLEELS